MHESADIFSLNVNDDTKSSHELISSQIEDTKWHIETVKGSEHQIEACRRLEYLMLAPKLALFCLLSDWLYLGCRMFMASKAAVVGPAALVVLSIEVCFAGNVSQPGKIILIFWSYRWTSSSTIAFCLGQSRASASS